MKEKFLLYDGDCLFCNRIAYFLSQKDREGRFLYIANTSQQGMDICKQYHLEELTQKTIVVKIGENLYTQSQAVYYFLKECKLFPLLRFFLKITPSFIADFVYDYIAQRRKSLGKYCPIPNR
ncbi:thiol-disulfide oxidoreductase DCC family protein [Capnocytophaga gingivalis]